MKKVLILLPAVFISVLALTKGWWSSPQHCEDCTPPYASVDVDSEEIFPNTSSGVDVTIDFKAPVSIKDQSMFFENGTFTGRFHYWEEMDGGRRLYLYDHCDRMVSRIENPEWVRVRK